MAGLGGFAAPGGFAAGAASVASGPTARLRPADATGTSVLPAPARDSRRTRKGSFIPWAAALAALGVLAVIIAFAVSAGSGDDPRTPPATPSGRVPGSAGVGNGGSGTGQSKTTPSRRPRTTAPNTTGPAQTQQPGPGPEPTGEDPEPTTQPTLEVTLPAPTDDGGGVEVSPTPP